MSKEIKRLIAKNAMKGLTEAGAAHGVGIDTMRYYANLDRSAEDAYSALNFKSMYDDGFIALSDFLFMVYVCGGHIVYDGREEA